MNTRLIVIAMLLTVAVSAEPIAVLGSSSPEYGYLSHCREAGGTVEKGKPVPKDLSDGFRYNLFIFPDASPLVREVEIYLTFFYADKIHDFPMVVTANRAQLFSWPADSLEVPERVEVAVYEHTPDGNGDPVGTAVFTSLFSNTGRNPAERITPDSYVWQKSVDLGNVPATHEVPMVFTLKNTASIPRAIRGVRATCNCTTILERPAKIPPNSIVEIPVLFNPSKYGGKHIKKKVAVNLDRGQLVILDYSASVR